MERLSIDLSGPRELGTCQSCGRHLVFAATGDKAQREHTTLWQEHDEHDKPEPIAVCLCRPCADALINPHPRLYRELTQHEPFPGAMPCCLGCSFAQVMSCTNPQAKRNGGPGVSMRFPKPALVHLNYGRRGGEWKRIYSTAVRCMGREDASHPATTAEGGRP